MKGRGYKDLVVWQKAMSLVLVVYRATENFPKNEQYGLTLQIRRCAVSLPSNIAEGSKRGTAKDFKYFLTIAFGSGAELETQIEIAEKLSYIKKEDYLRTVALLDECMRMLNAMINRPKD